MRLGEILVAADNISPGQLEQALETQVLLGARLGTCLVELGFIDLDGLANALAHQQKLPAALAEHFDRADPGLQRSLTADLAERYACVPLFRIGKRSAVIASTGPLDRRALAIVAEELGLAPDRLINSIAPELRIRYTLERTYNIPRPQRFLRAPGAPRAQPIKHAFLDVELLALDDADPPPPPPPNPGERRRYVPTLREAHAEDSGLIVVLPASEIEEIPDDELPTTVDMIAAGRDREEIASLTIAGIRRLVANTDAIVLLSLRGAIVVSSASFRCDGQRVPSIALPVDDTSAVSSALHSKVLVRSGPVHGELDRRLLLSLGLDGGHLVIAPLVVAKRSLAALVVASRVVVDAEVVEAISGASAAGLARLMREALD